MHVFLNDTQMKDANSEAHLYIATKDISSAYWLYLLMEKRVKGAVFLFIDGGVLYILNIS